MGSGDWVAAECNKRKKEPDYSCLIPISLTVTFINPVGKTQYVNLNFGPYTEMNVDALREIVRRIEDSNHVPVLKTNYDDWHISQTTGTE